jgi:hypothetical protein
VTEWRFSFFCAVEGVTVDTRERTPFSYFLCLICRYYLGARSAVIVGTRQKVINAGKEKEIQIERRVTYIVFLSTAVVPSKTLFFSSTCPDSSQL